MLSRIKIQNYALIESLDIEVREGLSVITGETGAGKSIIMGAMALMAGQRADTKVISKGAKKCVIEAEFEIGRFQLQDLFQEIDIDYDDTTNVRREISESGKSRAFINDTPCSLNVLKMFVGKLIDIHSQHSNLLLSSPKFQIDTVDSYADTSKELALYKTAYDDFCQCEKAYIEYVAKVEELQKEKDYIQFQYDQLNDANISQADEQDSLEQENSKLDNVEEIKSEFHTAYSAFDGEDAGVLSLLKCSAAAVRKVAMYVDGGENLLERLESMLIEAKDLSGEFEAIAEDMDFDPERKQYVEERLDKIYSLQQKHRVETVQELIDLKADYETKLTNLLDFDDDIKQMKEELEVKRLQMSEAANCLTRKRKSVVEELSNLMIDKLVFLGIANAACSVDITESKSYTLSGKDDVVVKFSANKNAELQPISAVASGGEMSRVMLCLKSIIADKMMMPTIIFDEIDTGVSGEIAHKMGLMMRDIAQKMQVLTITHLPQIASKGAHHYKVFKHDVEDRTISNIVRLNESERVEEIAEMLSGKNPSKSAVDNAKTLLSEIN